MKIARRENNYLIVKNDGTNVILTCAEAGLLINFIGKENLKIQITERVEEAKNDWLDLSEYNTDDFIQEIFEELEDEIDYGNSVSEEYIDERINDLGCFYGFEKEV